jgi:hypothetical protein
MIHEIYYFWCVTLRGNTPYDTIPYPLPMSSTTDSSPTTQIAISIVVPVVNPQTYLQGLIDSVRELDSDRIEIIFVNQSQTKISDLYDYPQTHRSLAGIIYYFWMMMRIFIQRSRLKNSLIYLIGYLPAIAISSYSNGEKSARVTIIPTGQI